MAERPTRPSPIIVGDPAWGAPRCRLCGGYFYSDQKMVRVKRFAWRKAFIHEEGACGRGIY